MRAKGEDPISGVNNEGSTTSGLSGAGDNTDQQEYKENYPFFVFCCCPDPLVTRQSFLDGTGRVQLYRMESTTVHTTGKDQMLWVGRDPHLLIMPLMDGLGHEFWLRPIIRLV